MKKIINFLFSDSILNILVQNTSILWIACIILTISKKSWPENYFLLLFGAYFFVSALRIFYFTKQAKKERAK